MANLGLGFVSWGGQAGADCLVLHLLSEAASHNLLICVSDASSTDQGAVNVSNVQDRANVRIGETCHQDTMITGAVDREVVIDTKQL